jgi:hypothetical protein
MDMLLNPDHATLWSAFGAVAQASATIMAIAALIYSMTSFRKSLKASHYTELDSMYFELLKIPMDKPHLLDPNVTRSGNQVIEYDIYAFMVWNFLEAVYDRCEHDKQLCSTWYPVVAVENHRHRTWFDRPDNRSKFKSAFHSFIGGGAFERVGRI